MTSRYVHGTSAYEQARLALMNDFLNAGALEAIGLEGGERILDLGAGLGQLSRALARAAGPRGRVVAIEMSPEQIAAARDAARKAGEEGLVDLREGNALDPPLAADEWGAFDIAHARFLLEHLPDPLAAVRVLVRAVRPGGRIVLQDDDHELLRLDPEPVPVRRLWDAYVATYARNGTDAYIGRRLPRLLVEAGARPTRIRYPFFGACAGERTFEPLVENLARILEVATATIVEAGLLDRQRCEEGLAALRAWAARPEAALWYAVSYAEGTKGEPAAPEGRNPERGTGVP